MIIRRNLEKQVEIYAKANETEKYIKVIVYFTQAEYDKVVSILNDLKMIDDERIVLIDARNDNKPSASKA